MGEEAFNDWADQQPELQADSTVRDEVFASLRTWLEAEKLLAGDFGWSSGGRAFRPPPDREEEQADSTDSERLEPGWQIGPYTLRRFLAKGGMGQVWAAEDRELRRSVALKLVLPGRVDERSMKLFSREARAGGRVQHPNIVTTLGYGTDKGLAWIAQELVEGSWTLRDSLDELRAAETIPKGYYREVADLVAKIADGMEAAHAAGVIHRDLKPQNILIAGEDMPKVTDFGLARVSEDSFFSRTGELIGTWAYMSPEQVMAKRMGLDHRTDVFSLGVVLYEMLTLRRPFEGDTTHQIAQAIVYHEPPSAEKVRSQCPYELAVIASKALDKLPGNRYATMADFGADLRRHLRDEPILARPPGPLRRASKWARRHPALSSAGAIAGGALVVVTTLSIQLAEQRTNLARANDGLRSAARNLREQTILAEDHAREALEQASRAEDEAAASELVADLLVEIFRAPDPLVSLGEEIPARVLLQRAVTLVDQEWAHAESVQARLASAIGTAYLHLGSVEQAEPLLERAHTLVLQGEGFTAEDRAAAAIDLARLEKKCSRYPDAERRLREVIEELPPKSEVALEAHLLLAGVLLDMTRADAAKPHLDAALAGYRDLGDEDNIVSCMITLGGYYTDKGDYSETERLYLDVMRMLEERGEGDSPAMLTTLSNLTTRRAELGRVEEAAKTEPRVLELAERIYGPESPDYGLYVFFMAAIPFYQKDYARSEEMIRTALRTTENLGPTNELRIRARYYLSGCLALQGNEEESIEVLQGVLHDYETHIGTDSRGAHATRTSLGEMLMRAGRHEDALELLIVAERGMRDLLEPGNPEVYKPATSVVEALLALGRPEEALEKVVELLDGAPPDSPVVAELEALYEKTEAALDE